MSADPYTVYEAGLRELLAALGHAHPHYSEALIYQQRLAENLAATRAYGDTETLRHDRARLIAQIGELAQTIGLAPLPLPHADSLDLAQALLDGLPLDTIPRIAPLPPGSQMPLARNPLFVGRETDLKQLAATLKGGKTMAIGQIAAATGLGGIGKTNLATEFVHRYGQFFAGGVFWLSFADAAAITGEIAACGVGLNLPRFEILKLDEQIARVRQEWQQPIPRLLIFDNCEDEALLEEWWPTSGGCRVLLTSRRARWSSTLNVTTLALGVLSRKESIALLHKHCLKLPAGDVDLAAIAAELGDLPLALHLAGSFLEFYHDDPDIVSPATFLAELRDARLLDHPALQGEDVTLSPTHHALHVGRTFTLSYERLRSDDAVDALAVALLARAACFAPGEPIPRDLLLATVELPDRVAQRRASKALNRLVDLGLLEGKTDRVLVLHRLLMAFVRAVVADVGAQFVVEGIVMRKARQLKQSGPQTAIQSIFVHLLHVTDKALEREDERAAKLCELSGFHLKQAGDLARARLYYERALVIRAQQLGPRHPATIRSLNNLGVLSSAQGEYTVARHLYEQSLTIRERVLGPTDPRTATALDNLAALLMMLDDYAAARPLCERALAIREQLFGPTSVQTARSLHNLAFLWQEEGDYPMAQRLYEQSLAIRVQELGLLHPLTATTLDNLAILLLRQGASEGAQVLGERALAIREQILGSEHPDTATSLQTLAVVAFEQHQYETAQRLCERALTIREQLLGPEHPDTAVSLYWKGRMAAHAGDREAARSLLQRAIAIARAVIGATHRITKEYEYRLIALETSDESTT
jgi:tetratricopeptide (TPR) repeat protein